MNDKSGPWSIFGPRWKDRERAYIIGLVVGFVWGALTATFFMVMNYQFF